MYNSRRISSTEYGALLCNVRRKVQYQCASSCFGAAQQYFQPYLLLNGVREGVCCCNMLLTKVHHQVQMQSS